MAMSYTFTVKPEHLKLIRAMVLTWGNAEFGAPAVDPKRPYGNSDVYEDIAEILGIDPNEADEEEMNKLHNETLAALQIAISVGYFKEGTYHTKNYGMKWVEV